MKKTALLCAILFVAGLIVGILFQRNATTASSTNTSTTESYKDYPLLAKRLFIDDPNDTIINFSELRSQIKEYISQNNLTGSIYFEYLPTGTSVRVEGDSEEVVASLFKVPAAMELYKASELGKIDLDQTITLKQEWLDEAFGTLYQKGAGYQLSLREAAKIMLENSDNTALKAIGSTLAEINLDIGLKPYTFADVDFVQNKDLTISTSSRSYTSFLKCLYFSCYLNHTDSQTLLELLTHSKDTARLKAGVDSDVTVAHKIGNFSQTTQSDCGIVYIPKRNYTLCIMLNGPDDAKTSAHIAKISSLAFQFVKSR